MLHREEAQGVPVSAGEEPVLQRRGHLPGVLEPARRSGVLLREPRGGPPPEVGEKGRPDEGVHGEPAVGTEASDE
jgi:hypothetical protein